MWEAPESSSGLQWGCCWGWAGEHCALKHAQPSPSPLLAPLEPACKAAALAVTSSGPQRHLPSKACPVQQELDLMPRRGQGRDGVQWPPALKGGNVWLLVNGCVTVWQ